MLILALARKSYKEKGTMLIIQIQELAVLFNIEKRRGN
jgi:hypothetical protein